MNVNKEIVETKKKVEDLQVANASLRKAGYVSLACNAVAFALITIYYVVM